MTVNIYFFYLVLFFISYQFESNIYADDTINNADNSNSSILKLSLKDCIDLSKKHNNFYKVADYNIKISEAQSRQASSAYFPSLSLNSHFVHLDKNPTMVMGPTTMSILGLDVDVPEQSIKLMNNDIFEGNIQLMYPLYTGGKISSINDQAKRGIEIAKYQALKNDIEIVAKIKKMYYNVLISKILYEIADDAFIKIKVTNDLSEKMFEEGSGTVLKTDMLKSKMMTNSVASVVKTLEYNVKMAIFGLKNSIGLESSLEIDIMDSTLSYQEFILVESDLVTELINNHPDLSIIKNGIQALNSQVDEAWSDLYPKVALFGNYTHIYNTYEYGMVSLPYRNLWNVGIGLQMPIFDGFLASNKADEAKAKVSKLTEQKKLLDNGLSTMLEVSILKMKSAMEQVNMTKSVLETAIENRDLNERAYQADLVVAQDMITAQIMESVMNARYQLAIFEYQNAKIDLEALVGKELESITKY